MIGKPNDKRPRCSGCGHPASLVRLVSIDGVCFKQYLKCNQCGGRKELPSDTDGRRD